MNTEKFKTLAQIHTTIKAIEEVRFSENLNLQLKFQLEKIAIKLWNIEQALIQTMGNELTEILTKETASLQRLSKQLNLDIVSLKKMTHELEKTVKLTRALTKILKIAIKVGL